MKGVALAVAIGVSVGAAACLDVPPASVSGGDGGASSDASPCPELGSNWWDCDFLHRSRLTIDNSDQSEDLLDFPLLLVLDETRLPRDQVQDGGGDLRFVDSDGVVLAHEIEAWDEDGPTFVWVKVPKIDASSDDHLWMYHGDPVAADGQNAAAVWTDALAVWHAGQDPSGPTPQIRDSSGSDNDGSADPSMTAAQLVTGRIGGAVRFDGSDDEIVFGPGGSDNLTVEAWVNPEGFAAGTNPDWVDVIVATGDGYGGGSRVMFAVHGDRTLELRIGSSAELETLCFSSSTLTANEWHHVAGVVDAITNEVRVYINGQLEGVERAIDIGASAAEWWMGAMDNETFPYQLLGALDEIRLSRVVRSDAWIRAQYLSMTDAFVTYSPSAP
jgi:hypothetical protein